jgi:hypothetical protein
VISGSEPYLGLKAWCLAYQARPNDGLKDRASVVAEALYSTIYRVDDACEGADSIELFLNCHIRVTLEGIHAVSAQDQDFPFECVVYADRLGDDGFDENLLCRNRSRCWVALCNGFACETSGPVAVDVVS